MRDIAPFHENATLVDEDALLPGALASKETTGSLPGHAGITEIKFDPISEQQFLLNQDLKSNGVELHYALSHADTLLTATAGENGPAVFQISLSPQGNYTFLLNDHIDRANPPNLIPNEYELSLRQTLGDPHPTKVSLSHNVDTIPSDPYQLEFYYKPPPQADPHHPPIQVYWDDQLLFTLPSSGEEKGYIFSLEGNPYYDSTKLQFVGIENEVNFKNLFHDVSVTTAASQLLPLAISYTTVDSEGNTSHDQLTVNLTTTIPIQLTNQEPMSVVYDQGVYQTIIVNEENQHQNPLATINLDTLFNHLAIQAENRLVEVIQREENGLGTNVYEVKISDKSESREPITVADVQLSFPGGDGGLHVFQKNIIIQEGASDLPNHLPPELI